MKWAKVKGFIRMEILMSSLNDPLLTKKELERIKVAARRSHLAGVAAVWAVRVTAVGLGAWLTYWAFFR